MGKSFRGIVNNIVESILWKFMVNRMKIVEEDTFYVVETCYIWNNAITQSVKNQNCETGSYFEKMA